jgi:Polysaccharide pyruvyl transferase
MSNLFVTKVRSSFTEILLKLKNARINFSIYIRRKKTNLMSKMNFKLATPTPATAGTHADKPNKYLILGFFDRGNVGDEAFIPPYKVLFPDADLTFLSMDDAETIPADTTAVIVAGGDVINAYFVRKLKLLLQSYNGPCYAFSVGIPYISEKNLGEVFDHVVLRNRQDVDAVASAIGEKNIDYLPDITWMLNALVAPKAGRLSHKPFTIGVCLAQPYFSRNPLAADLEDSVVEFITRYATTNPHCQINLIPFNTSGQDHEADTFINARVYARVSGLVNVANITGDFVKDPVNMLEFVGQHDMIVGMRYHSILFSMMRNVPFVAMYTTKKIENMLKDHGFDAFGLRLPCDAHYRPTHIDVDTLTSLVDTRKTTTSTTVTVDLDRYAFIRDIVTQKKRKQIIVKSFSNLSTEEVLVKCKDMVKTYLKLDDEAYEKWSAGDTQTKTVLAASEKVPLDFARLLCFALTNKIGSPYVWGLNENMMKPDFIPFEAMKWIYEDHVSATKRQLKDHVHYPVINIDKQLTVDVNYMCQDNYQGLHRSGWSYVISGFQHIDTLNVQKPSVCLVDTCLERTFLWGLDITKTASIVPYTKPWSGFIHHTFDTEYSKLNCESLLDTKEFTESLATCKCLFTLSRDLQEKFQRGLEVRGYSVPVLSLNHPTEFVDNNFDMTKFLSNRHRRVVNIGAWIRDPYAIYALPVPANNKLAIRKSTLKGREMDNYFMPDNFIDELSNFLIDYTGGRGPGGLSRVPCENPDQTVSRDVVSRDTVSRDCVSRDPISNKYLSGMLNNMTRNQNSVDILDNYSNEDYDTLLSENIVFLSFMSDPSASNTVVECIVRNTPLIVNRFPALEEVLGEDYPGFYPDGNLFQAAAMSIDLNHIFLIHQYLKRLDKTKFYLEHFMADFQAKLASAL